MPLPLFIGAAAFFAGAAGLGSGIHGAVKLKEANDTMQSAEYRHKSNQARFEKKNHATTETMDEVGKLELEVLDSFKRFSDVYERIQNRPQFKEYEINGVKIPKYDPEELKKVSVGAGVLLGGISGAALGTAGGFAAAGATTAAVMALGTASTGTAIASLTGAAATNATLAALGGGAIAAGGGGIALGTTVLGAATLGVGLLVGGVIFSIAGSSVSSKADEAWAQMRKAEKEIDRICEYLDSLESAANKFIETLKRVNKVYTRHLELLAEIVAIKGKTDWYEFTPEEKHITENTVLLVGLLYEMCKVKLVQQAENENDLNTINHADIDKNIADAENFMRNRNLDLAC